MSYKGKFHPKNKEKYEGNVENIFFRSLWERQVMRWCDENPNVVEWNSEEIIIPYLCETDNCIRRYFVDFKIRFNNGETFLVEVKPKKQTAAPIKPQQRQTKRYISESLTYIKNQSKWKAAKQYANKYGMKFVIWTEDTLKQLGIKITNENVQRKNRRSTKKPRQKS
jgi:hypothetical protein